MKLLSRTSFVLAVTAVLATPGTGRGQIPYRWDRTAQTLGTRSNVTLTAQASTTGGGLTRQATNEDLIGFSLSPTLTRDAFGGEGGGGGNTFPFGAHAGGPGPNGRNGVPLDGEDGDDGGGQGGQAGFNGYADVHGSTTVLDELNQDLQTILSYAWIHNQSADVELLGGGGGGGGGGGAIVDGIIVGGGGGGGGGGEAAAGAITSVQDSDVNVSARCVWAAGIPVTTPAPLIPCSITLDMGWVSGANPDWSAAPWARRIDVTVTAGLSVLTITGGPTGPITAAGNDDNGTPFLFVSSDLLGSDTGSFGLGAGDIGQTFVAPTGPTDTNATIISPQNAITSTLTGSLSAGGGSGGDGGAGESSDPPVNGADGADAGNGLGGAGGDGGAGANANAGRGGAGGAGEFIGEHKDGIYQGLIEIFMDP